MKITLIANPVSGRSPRKKIEAAHGLLKEKGHEVRLLLTGERGDAERFAASAAETAEAGDALIIAAGGDGTFNEVVNGLICAKSQTPMAIIPLGTTNVLARELGIPDDVEGAVEIATGGRTYSASAGKISFPGGRSRYFILMAGVGFDGETVRRTGESKNLKKISGKGAYILSGMRTLLSWRPEELALTVDGKNYKARSLIVSKARKYAGDFELAPDADITDPHLYAFIMHGGKRTDILRYVFGIVSGKHLALKDITFIEAEEVRIEGRAAVQLDGDSAGETPAVVSVVPGAFRLVY